MGEFRGSQRGGNLGKNLNIFLRFFINFTVQEKICKFVDGFFVDFCRFVDFVELC